MAKLTVKTKPGVKHFNRAGFRFTSQEQTVEASEEQAKLIKDCSMLVCVGEPEKKASKPLKPETPSIADEVKPSKKVAKKSKASGAKSKSN